MLIYSPLSFSLVTLSFVSQFAGPYVIKPRGNVEPFPSPVEQITIWVSGWVFLVFILEVHLQFRSIMILLTIRVEDYSPDCLSSHFSSTARRAVV